MYLVAAYHRDGGGRDRRAFGRLHDVQEVHRPVQGLVREGRQRSHADRDGIRDGWVPQHEVGLDRGAGHSLETVLGSLDSGGNLRIVSRANPPQNDKAFIRLLLM